MASKNLGAVIQRAISDGAFRRQLQSDPAAALRGFNLTPDEIAAIRSGDSGKLMSLGVDQRMSKLYTAGTGFLGASRSTVSDLNAGGTASVISNDPTNGVREGIVGDPAASSREALTTGNFSGTRAVHDVGPFEGNVNGLADPTVGGSRAIHDSGPTDLRAAATTGDVSGARAVHDSEPFVGNAALNDNFTAANAGRGGSLAGDMSTGSTRAIHDSGPTDLRAATTTGDVSGARAIHDSGPTDLRAAATTGDVSGARAVNDSEPFAGNAALNDNFAAGAAGRGGSLAGDMSTNARAVNDSEPFAGNAVINDNIAAANAGRGGSLAGEMSSGGSRAIHDVAPFGTPGTSAIEDPNSTEFAAAHDAGTSAAASAAAGDPYSGSYTGVSPDFQAGGNMIAADDNLAVSSRMADAGNASSIRGINDVAPFEGNVDAAAPSGGEFLGTDARLDPGIDSSKGFVPSDSADVQREMLDGTSHGDALGNTGGGGHPS